MSICLSAGTEDGTRTHNDTELKSVVYANSTTSAYSQRSNRNHSTVLTWLAFCWEIWGGELNRHQAAMAPLHPYGWPRWWDLKDLNPRHFGYEPDVLTSWTKAPDASVCTAPTLGFEIRQLGEQRGKRKWTPLTSLFSSVLLRMPSIDLSSLDFQEWGCRVTTYLHSVVNRLLQCQPLLEPEVGIEPTHSVWKTDVLPLDDSGRYGCFQPHPKRGDTWRIHWGYWRLR